MGLRDDKWVNGPTFVASDGIAYEVLGVLPDQRMATIRALWPAERRDRDQWWCCICFQNRGDGKVVPCEHYSGMQPPVSSHWTPENLIALIKERSGGGAISGDFRRGWVAAKNHIIGLIQHPPRTPR